jgi:hypothetical protein
MAAIEINMKEKLHTTVMLPSQTPSIQNQLQARAYSSISAIMADEMAQAMAPKKDNTKPASKRSMLHCNIARV